MKARLKDAAKVVNPLYNHKAAQKAKSENRGYPHSHQIDVGPGYVLSGDKCWIHCCPGLFNADPIAEPVDKECMDRVRHFMETTRPQQLRRIQNLVENIDMLKDADQKREVMRMANAYGILPGTEDPHADLVDRLENTDTDQNPSADVPDEPHWMDADASETTDSTADVDA